MKSDLSYLRKEIVHSCLWLQKERFVIGTWGNVSIRVGEYALVTPSRIQYDVLHLEDLVLIDLEGHVVEGHCNPTSEKDIHRLIYKNRDDVGAVVHCHSEYACAVSSTGRSIPPLIEEMSQLLGGEIPCTGAYVPAGRHIELAEITVAALGDKMAVLLRNHGSVCCGKDLEEALLVCLVVEKAAKMFTALEKNLEPVPIPEEFVEKERYRFLHKYGKEK